MDQLEPPEADVSDEPWPTWDPIMDGVHSSLKKSFPPVPAPTRWRRVRMVAHHWAWRTKQRWLDYLLWVTVVGIFIGAAVVAAFGWPLTAEDETYAETVVAAASVTAFSGAILSAIGVPLNAANGIAAGHTAAMVRRPGPWLAGFYLITQSGFLFVLAAFSPDRSGAIVSGLLAAGGFGVVWLAVRALISSSDLHDVATRQARFIRRQASGGQRHLRSQLTMALPKQLRTPEMSGYVSADSVGRSVTGVLGHLRSGFRSFRAQGRDAEALVFWETMVEIFFDYADLVDDEVGGRNGSVSILFSTLDEVVTADLHGRHDELAASCLASLTRLAERRTKAWDFGAVRALLHHYLGEWVSRTWDNDETILTVRAVDSLSHSLNCYCRYGNSLEARGVLRMVGELATKAAIDRRGHIGVALQNTLVAAVPAIAAANDPAARELMLDTWSDQVTISAEIRATELDVTSSHPTEVILPGHAIDRGGLQEAMWLAAEWGENAADQTLTTVLRWLADVMPGLAAVDDPLKRPHTEAMQLLCCVGLVADSAIATHARRAELGAQIAATAIDWLPHDNADAARDVLFTFDDLSEMIWSSVLAAGFIADEPAIVRDASATLMRCLAVGEDIGTVNGDYSRRFLEGLMIAAGIRDDLVAAVARETMPRFGFGGDGGTHIEEFSRGPSMNRNRTVNKPSQIDAINGWALVHFPLLDSYAPDSA